VSEPLDLDAIEARAKAATPGPWNYEHDTELEKGCRCGSCLEPIDGRMIVESRKHDMVAVADARFIAHAREDVPALIAELRRLREENARLKAFAEAVVENFDCDCEELPTGDTCFWCKAKEALRRAKP